MCLCLISVSKSLRSFWPPTLISVISSAINLIFNFSISPLYYELIFPLGLIYFRARKSSFQETSRNRSLPLLPQNP